MKLVIYRQSPIDDGVPGGLSLDGVRECYTLERLSALIPVGVYVVDLTVSQRSLAGKLWSPDADHRLPLLLDVPGRSGIRIHSANEPGQLGGCIAVGEVPAGDHLRRSQAALTRLWQKLVTQPHLSITIDIQGGRPVSSQADSVVPESSGT